MAKAKRTDNADDWARSDLAKKEGNRLSRSAKRKNIRDELKACENDNTQFWRKIQKLIPDAPKHQIIQLLDESKNIPVPDCDVADYINSFFAGIGEKLSSNMYDVWRPYDNREVNTILEFSCTVNEVKDVVKLINPKKSSAIPNMSNMVLKDAFLHITDKITELFNCSFMTATVPVSWKRAIIVPIFKSGNPRYVGNYRPIALTPTPCELIEKLAHKIRITPWKS